MRTKYHCSINHAAVPINRRVVWKGNKWHDFRDRLKRTTSEWLAEFAVGADTVDVTVFNQHTRVRSTGKAQDFLSPAINIA